MSVDVRFSPSGAPQEKAQITQVFLSRKADGTVRQIVRPISFQDDKTQAQLEQVSQALMGRWKRDGVSITFLDFKNLTVTYSDGVHDKIELDAHVQAIRKLYTAFATRAEIPFSWSKEPNHPLSPLAGPESLHRPSDRTRTLSRLSHEEAAERLEITDSRKQKRGEAIAHFLDAMPNAIEARIAVLEKEKPLPKERIEKLQVLKRKFEHCDRFALYGALEDRQTLEAALKTEKGELKEGIRGTIFRTRTRQLTEGEKAYLDVIAAFHQEPKDFVENYQRLSLSGRPDCFEHFLFAALEKGDTKDAVAFFCRHPQIVDLELEEADMRGLFQDLEAALGGYQQTLNPSSAGSSIPSSPPPSAHLFAPGPSSPASKPAALSSDDMNEID